MDRGRVLAIDYGSKNVGLASSDELGVVVHPLPSIPNLSRRDLLRRLKVAVKELQVDSIVVGLPMNMDGTSGDAVHRVRHFMDLLRR